MPRAAAASCLAIALGAFALRLSLAGFPENSHQDEPIAARLALRNAAAGWSATSVRWDAIPDWKWARPTYQFSPHTLLSSAVVGSLGALEGRPLSQGEAIRLIRGLSAACSALAGVFVFLAALRLGAGQQTAALAQALHALSPLSVQDGVYARVDALVGMLSAAAVWLSLAGLAAGSTRRIAAAGAAGGLCLAAKYNAFVGLLAAAVAALAPRPGDRLSARVGRLLLAAGCAALAFLAGTPELLLDRGPFFEGLGYEWSHYAEGHVPHQAFSAADANWRYWPAYFGWIGLGWLALGGAALGFFGRGATDPRLAALWRGLLAVAVLAAALPRVRFERNWEPALGLFCLAAAWGSGRLARAGAAQFPSGVPSRAALALLLAAPLFQPALVTSRLAAALEPGGSPWAALKRTEAIAVTGMAFAFNRPEVNWPNRAFDLALVDFGDAYSAEGLPRWQAFAKGCASRAYESYWSRFGYPFSTIDVYHGPRRLLFFPACPLVGEAWRPEPPPGR